MWRRIVRVLTAGAISNLELTDTAQGRTTVAKRNGTKGGKPRPTELVLKEAAERARRERIEQDLQNDIMRFLLRQHFDELDRERKEREERNNSDSPNLLELLLPP